MNIQSIIAASVANESLMPVSTALYQLNIVMNEDHAHKNEEKHLQNFSAEFQRALDAGFFSNLRYDSLEFEVVSRTVLHTAPGTHTYIPR
jgi:hypothetical protein